MLVEFVPFNIISVPTLPEFTEILLEVVLSVLSTATVPLLILNIPLVVYVGKLIFPLRIDARKRSLPFTLSHMKK